MEFSFVMQFKRIEIAIESVYSMIYTKWVMICQSFPGAKDNGNDNITTAYEIRTIK